MTNSRTTAEAPPNGGSRGTSEDGFRIPRSNGRRDNGEDGARSTTPLNVFVVDDDPNVRKILSMYLEMEGHRVTTVANSQQALEELSRRSIDLAFVDMRLGTESGMDLIPALKGSSPWTKVVMMTGMPSIDTAVEAMKIGASDYLQKPLLPGQVQLITRKVAEFQALEQKVQSLQDDAVRHAPQPAFTTSNPAMEGIFELAHQVADSDACVLLGGESGTGKTLLAKSIHLWSARAKKPFLVVSCPSLSTELLESELFGHVRGAFTGALRENPGRVAACEGGTLFLDEIGDLPLMLQPKLLRFIQDREYEAHRRPLPRQADVRIIAATNVNLEQAVRDGKFREDLYYRLNVVQIDLPPLRDRREDILPLAESMVAFSSQQQNRRVRGLSEEAKKALAAYHWPGNIRELRNVIERSVLLATSDLIGPDALRLKATLSSNLPQIGDPISLDQLEEMHIRRIVESAPSLEQAAKSLGIDVATLWRKRKKFAI